MLNFFVQAYESSIEKCSDLCKSYGGCGWFTYDAFPSVCLLFKDCPTLDESFESCSSSSSLCKAKTSNPQFQFLRFFLIEISNVGLLVYDF
jgi:hypothetical protein